MLTHNAHEIAVQLDAHGAAVEREVFAEAARLAQEVERRMRERAPKWRSTLTNSIAVTMPAPMTWEVRPGVAYAQAQEKGRKPGKGLPRFFDPAARPLVEWLMSKAFAGLRRAKVGTLAMQRRELSLRDRYMALSWHARHKGLKATPFVEPTFREFEVSGPQRLAQAVQRAVAAANGLGGGGVA